MADSISTLAEELLKRELATNPDQFKTPTQAVPVSPSGGISPGLLATLGGLADAASTYTFMKRGTGVETNPLVTGIAGSNPEATGLMALGGLGLTKALTHLIRKKYPKVADALAANLGAEQLGLSVANFNGFGDGQPSAFRQYDSALARHTTRGFHSKSGR